MHSSQLRQFVVAVVLFTCCSTPLRSQLSVVVPSVDLGVVRGGQNLTHRFELANSGSESIEILEVQRGCGCLAVQLELRIIPAGRKTSLTMELRTLGQADGPHTWAAQVRYRLGQETKSLPLNLRGVVESEIIVQPAILGLHVSKTVEQEITLTDRRATPLRVLDVEPRAPGVKVTRIERTGSTTKILVVADGTELSTGRHEGLLSITTDDADYRQLRIPIVVTKAAAATVRSTPEQVELRPADGRTTALVRLRSMNDQPVRIAKIEPSDPALICTWAPGPGKDATLKIQAKGATSQGTIQVHFESPAGETLTMPVTIAR